jgi:hypothetical protein
MPGTDISIDRRDVVVGLIASLALGRSMARAEVAQERDLTGLESGLLDKKDVTRALQQSLNAAAKKTNKGLVQLPPGRFAIQPLPNENAALVLPSGIRLQGAGIDRTIISMAENAFGHLINAPYGNIEIAELTIDGNAPNRQGQIGHNLRVEGDNILIENLKLINSASYGIGIGQRRFARNVIVRNVEIEGAGADGIDIKNTLSRTENIRIDNVHVRGFALRTRRRQAGVDLRGLCQVENIRITDVPAGCDGLRFRPGEAGQVNGPGAHGSKGARISVSGTAGMGTGVSVVARDVELSDVTLSGLRVGLFVAADNLVLRHGAFRGSSNAAIRTRATEYSRPSRVTFYSCSLSGEKLLLFGDVDTVKFYDTSFESCLSKDLIKQLDRNALVSFERCQFDSSCK